MKSKTLNKTEKKRLNNQIKERFGIDIIGKKDVVVEVSDEFDYYKVNNEIDWFIFDSTVAPTLKNLLRSNFLKRVVVDMGAVKFVASGADVMRPGVIAVDDGITSGDVVSVVDENNNKPLGIGIAMFDSSGIRDLEGGKCVKSVHFVGDKIWNIES